MDLTFLDKYLIMMNAVGFAAFALNAWLSLHTAKRQSDALLMLLSLLGGSLGIMIAVLLLDRKAVKDNMMSRVFVSCILVIQVIAVLTLKGFVAEKITLAFWIFFAEHRLFSYYLLLINLLTFAAFAIDKRRAVKNRPRVRIVTLLALSFVGGSLGGMAAMQLFHHKTRKDYFAIGEPLMLLMQSIVLFYLMNARLP